MRCFEKYVKNEWHFVFVSKAKAADENGGSEWEGMVGHVVKVVKN